MKTENILALAAGALVGIYVFKPKEGAVGASVIDSKEESLRLAVQLGLLDLKGKYEQDEAGKGHQMIWKRASQRLGPDHKDQREEITSAINDGGGWIADRVTWLLNGSYGSEWKYWADRLIATANTSGAKAFNRSLDSATKQIVLALILAENFDVNRSAVMSAIEKADPIQNEILLQKAKNEIIDYYLEQSEYFNR